MFSGIAVLLTAAAFVPKADPVLIMGDVPPFCPDTAGTMDNCGRWSGQLLMCLCGLITYYLMALEIEHFQSNLLVLSGPRKGALVTALVGPPLP